MKERKDIWGGGTWTTAAAADRVHDGQDERQPSLNNLTVGDQASKTVSCGEGSTWSLTHPGTMEKGGRGG